MLEEMIKQRHRYQTPTEEMERRWNVVLKEMEKEGVDSLLFGAYDRWFHGVAKYLTDVLVWNYPNYYLFSKEGISGIGHGGWGTPGVAPYVAYRNFIDNVAIPSLPSTSYGYDWVPENLAEFIKKHNYKRIGICSSMCIPLPVYKYLIENLPDVEFIEFDRNMEYIMAVKSEWEIDLHNKVVKLHEDIMACVPTIVRPGRTEREVSRLLRSIADDLNCAELNVLAFTTSMPGNLGYYYQNHVIQPNDYYSLLCEVSGPHGEWAELGRMYKVGDPPGGKMKQMHSDVLTATDEIAKYLVPGAKCGDVFDKLNEILVGLGYPPETRVCIHGQGYDIVQRPMIVAADDMILKENMFIAIHPFLNNEEGQAFNCDNYWVKEGGAQCINKAITREIIHVTY